MTRHLQWIVAVLVIVGAATLTTMGGDRMRAWQSKFLSSLAPVLRLGAATRDAVGSPVPPPRTPEEIAAENVELREENRQLRMRQDLLRDLEKENNSLREALEYRRRSVFKLIPARVISRDASAWWNTAKINRGSADGVREDCPVLTEKGLVGKVTVVSPHESVILLLTDENCKVAAKVEGTREQGILFGVRVQTADTGELQMTFLSKNADLQAGQKIYSTGSGGVFPSGIPLGTVKSFHVRELDGQVIAEPAEDISRVEDVFVIVGAK